MAIPQEELLYGIDDKPPIGESISLGFQHYLTMFGSTVVIPLIIAEQLGMDNPADVAWLIGTMFFVSGIATLLQTTVGNRLPIVQGGTFSLLSPAIALMGMAALSNVGWEVRMQHLQGAIIVGGLVEAVLGYSGLVGRVLKFIGPITIAPTIALIGLALFELGAPKAGTDWVIGGLTILLIIGFSQYLRTAHRVFELYPIIFGVVGAWMIAALGTAVGWFPGPEMDAAGNVMQSAHPSHVNTSGLESAPWLMVPYPFQWGWPIFSVAAIVGMLAGFAASIVESVGDYFACARLSGAPVPDSEVVNKGIGIEGIGCVIAGIFGTGNGTTSYSENIGAIGLTRVGSRRVVQAGAIVMLVLSVFGKFGGLFTTIPEPVIGGLYCAMFGMIAAVGLSNLQHVDLNSPRNLFILGFSLFMGLSLPEYFGEQAMVDGVMTKINHVQFSPQWIADLINTLGESGMIVGAIIAVVLDNTVPGTDEERGLHEWGTGTQE